MSLSLNEHLFYIDTCCVCKVFVLTLDIDRFFSCLPELSNQKTVSMVTPIYRGLRACSLLQIAYQRLPTFCLKSAQIFQGLCY